MTEAVLAARTAVRSEGPSRDMLLNAASDLMIETGTHDVSLHAIARKAGVTAPLVKYYFGGKDGLLIALVERDTARSLGQLDELLAMAIDPVSKMRIHIMGIVRTYSRYPYLLGLFNQLLRGANAEASDRIKGSFVMPLIQAQRQIVEEGVAAGVFRPLDPDMVYFITVGACQYLFASRVAFRDVMGGKPADPAFARDFATAAVDVVLNGLKT